MTIIKKINSNKQSNFILQRTKNRRQTKPEINRGKEIIKIWAEINKMESISTVEKINETKSCFLEDKIDKF